MIQQCGDGQNVAVAEMFCQLTDSVHDFGVLPKSLRSHSDGYSGSF